MRQPSISGNLIFVWDFMPRYARQLVPDLENNLGQNQMGSLEFLLDRIALQQ